VPNPAPIRVNRAPVLTLWATVVAERLGHPEATALSLGSAVAGTAAQAKARRLGLAEKGEGGALAPRQRVPLLGREIPVAPAPDGTLRAARPDGSPEDHAPVAQYLARAFGKRLQEARAAMRALAARLPPDELDRVGFRLYEAFRPDVPEGVQGWGAKGELHLERILGAKHG
jgi:hypothetical protein